MSKSGSGPIRLSILIPVFNESHYIDECITSILQNKSRNFEIIVSDNHSTDDTATRLRRYNDERLKVIQPPSRLSPQRNHWYSFENSRGSYIYFIGGDDYLAPGIIDECIDLLDGETILMGAVETFHDGSGNIRAIYNDRNVLGIIGEGSIKFLRNYLKRLNHDELVYAFVPRRLFGTGIRLSDHSLETMFPWNVILIYFSDAKHLKYLDKTIFRKRYDKVHPAGDFFTDAYTASFLRKALGSIYNSFYTSIKLKSLVVLFILLFSNRSHDGKGGFLGVVRRERNFWYAGPSLMALISPLLDLLHFGRNVYWGRKSAVR